MRIKSLIFLIVLLLISGAVFLNRVAIRDKFYIWQKPALPKAVEYSGVIANESASLADEMKQSQNQDGIASVAGTLPRNDIKDVPLQYNLDVPFQSQAPTGDWNMPYQEACEEASLIMADAFYNKTSLTVGEMDERIKKLVDWQVKKFGYYEDTTVEEVVIIAREYFGLKAELDDNVSVDNIKKYISQNKLVLVPVAGKILPNPNFRNGGPIYHMLVIRGYTPDKFITNDPGTRKGKEFVYGYNDLINAVHAWPRPTGGSKRDVTEAEMLTGRKVLIVIDRVK